MTRFFAFQSETCASLETQAAYFCIPNKEQCGNDGGLIVPCGEEYQCSDCCGELNLDWYLPFLDTDTIQIQSRIHDFYNADRENPLAGFGSWIDAVIVDLNTNTESDISNYVTANGAFVGWNGRNSYQIIELDGSLLPNCWKLIYRVYNDESPQDELQELCSQHFKKGSCNGTLLIQGLRKGFDSEGNYYDLPLASFGDTPYFYNNQIRLEGYIKDAVPEKTTTQRQGRNIVKTIKYVSQVHLLAVPMFVIAYLENQILSAKNIKIDGKVYTAETGTSEAVESTCLFNYTFNLINIVNESEC